MAFKVFLKFTEWNSTSLKYSKIFIIWSRDTLPAFSALPCVILAKTKSYSHEWVN